MSLSCWRSRRRTEAMHVHGVYKVLCHVKPSRIMAATVPIEAVSAMVPGRRCNTMAWNQRKGSALYVTPDAWISPPLRGGIEGKCGQCAMKFRQRDSRKPIRAPGSVLGIT
jgi:hypothetical protein